MPSRSKSASTVPGPSSTPSSQIGGVTEPSQTTCPAFRPAEDLGRAGAGQPGQRFQRVAQQVPPVAGADHLAADAEFAPRGAEVEAAPIGDGGAEHAGGMEDLVGDQGRGAERGEVAVALLDDLDRREDLGDGRRGLAPGAGAEGEVRPSRTPISHSTPGFR